ncbi:hypothetical protein ACVBEF_14870 [Glaciimonas sp. GG7]
MSALHQLALVQSFDNELKSPLTMAEMIADARLIAPDRHVVQNFESVLASENRQFSFAQYASSDDATSYISDAFKEHPVTPIPEELSASGMLAFNKKLEITMVSYQIGGHFITKSANHIDQLVRIQ